MENEIYISGFAFGNFASFKNLQYMAPCKKINIIIGQNNSGKSNVIKYLATEYKKNLDLTKKRKNLIFSNPFTPHSKQAEEQGIAFCIQNGSRDFNEICSSTNILSNISAQELHSQVLKTISAINSDLGFVHIKPDGQVSDFCVTQVYDKYQPAANTWSKVGSSFNLSINSNADVRGRLIPHLLQWYVSKLQEPLITLVPCIRDIHHTEVNKSDDPNVHFDGTLIIRRLAMLESPKHDDDQKRKQFENITQFIREITGDSEAKISIPYERNTINVYMNKKWLPIESLGTGIQEVIILSAAATALQKQIVCIEEPELHLHPELQRKLIRYLAEKTNNQYFITTHSAHILDTPDAEIFHVQLVNESSIIARVTDDLDKFGICRDLGYRASDLLQTNAIIWVEGPSDRIYINHWLQEKAPEFKEGLHYSIMFYGGRLLSHLSAQDSEITDFISLHRLNQNMAIVIDSDRTKEGERINSTKSRIKKEFETRKDFVWLTAGREIENYIKSNVLSEAIEKVHGTVRMGGFGRFDKCLDFKRGKTAVLPKKAEIARRVVEDPSDYSVLDLDKRINELIKFIKRSNHIKME